MTKLAKTNTLGKKNCGRIGTEPGNQYHENSENSSYDINVIPILCDFDESLNTTIPIASMYGIFTYIYHYGIVYRTCPPHLGDLAKCQHATVAAPPRTAVLCIG